MDEENELIALRRKKLDALHEKGVEPFGAWFRAERIGRRSARKI